MSQIRQTDAISGAAEADATDDAQEALLIASIADGNRDALSRLYLNYQPRLFKFVYRLTGSYSAADELVNDVLLVVWNKALSFRGDSRVSTWIFGIAYRLTMRRVSRRQVRLIQARKAADEEPCHEPALETEDLVTHALAKLPVAHRITVILVFYFGLTYEETARITGCPVNTVKTRMYHARRKLKDAVGSLAEPGGEKSGESDG